MIVQFTQIKTNISQIMQAIFDDKIVTPHTFKRNTKDKLTVFV